MAIFLSILRGINVSGQRKVPMAQLKALYEAMGFKQVVTYIQSGNVVFEHPTAKGLQQQIETAIKAEFGFEVPVIIRTKKEMAQLLAGNPFLSEKEIDPAKLHVTFLEKSPDAALLEKVTSLSFLPDQFTPIANDIYLYIPDSYGNTKLSNAFFEQKLKVTATTRNWKTVLKVSGLMGID